jgi:F-type H+-transporting ATPase subunit epsilon
MSDRLQLEVVTPQRKVLEVQATEVRLPGTLGEMGVLPGHTPLLTTLAIGQLTVIGDDGEQPMAIFGGFAEVLPDRVTVLAGGAEGPEDVDVEASKKAKAEAEAALQGADAESAAEAMEDLQKAVVRLQVAGHPVD